MRSSRSMSRRDFLHGIFRPSASSADGDPSEENFSSGQSCLSMLPPEFSGSMLKMEAARLGGDVENMTEEEMAALVVRTMFGAAPSASRQEAHGTALEQERVPVE